MHETGPSYRPLLISVASDLQSLCGQTIALAKAETSATVQSTVRYAAGVLIGAVLAIVGVLVLVSALVLIGVAIGLPPWAAASAVALVFVSAGGATIYFSVAGLQHVEFSFPPHAAKPEGDE